MLRVSKWRWCGSPRCGNIRLRHPPLPSVTALLLLCRLTAGHTEAQTATAVRWDEGVAVCRPAVVREVPPPAAAKHAVGALAGPDGSLAAVV